MENRAEIGMRNGKGDMILTFDIGTTGNKCTLFDTDGRECWTETVPYPSYYPKPGWAEQDPEDFWQSTVTGTRHLMERSGLNPARIAVIGLSGHMNGCIPVDRTGSILYKNIIHSDIRSGSECDEIAKHFDEKTFYNITGNRLDPHYTLPKILWLRRNYPEVYEASAFFVNTKDYVSYKLTGSLGITDYSDASLTCMLDMQKRDWAVDMVKELGLDPSRLPTLKRSHDIAGRVTSQAAALLGIHAGTPVVVGGGDGACAAKGAGIMEKGLAYNYIGSSSWISTLSRGPVLDREARIFNYYDLDGEHCNVCGTVQCAAAAYDWAIENIGRYEAEQAEKGEGNIFDMVERLAGESPVGANGVFFLPYLMGERTPLWDEKARGGFIGFTLFNKRNDLFRAVYEGIAFALRSVLDVFEDNRLQVGELTLIGGGAKSKLWNGIMSNVYRRPVRVHRFPGEATSLGAAIASGVGVGIFPDFKSAGKLVEYARRCEPDNEQADAYEKHFRIFKKMYPALKPVFDEIADLDTEIHQAGS